MVVPNTMVTFHTYELPLLGLMAGLLKRPDYSLTIQMKRWTIYEQCRGNKSNLLTRQMAYPAARFLFSFGVKTLILFVTRTHVKPGCPKSIKDWEFCVGFYNMGLFILVIWFCLITGYGHHIESDWTPYSSSMLLIGIHPHIDEEQVDP